MLIHNFDVWYNALDTDTKELIPKSIARKVIEFYHN